MEESKTMDFKPKANESERPEKMSYEQLENVAHQLSEQNTQLYMKLQEASLGNMFKRLDYLFKVIEIGHMFNEEFLAKCVSEIETTMTIPEETDKENTDN